MREAKKVFIEGGDGLVSAMFEVTNGSYKVVDSVEEADILVFTGGADVPPKYYGEKQLDCTMCTPWREEREEVTYHQAVAAGKRLVGICRGGQFLNVLNGGKMWQDVDNHAIYGTHPVYDIETAEWVECTSTHHQMMRVGEGGVLVAHGGQRTNMFVYEQGGKPAHRFRVEGENDVEVVWYPETRSLCFQPHPEYGVEECKNYFFALLERYE